MVLFARLLAVRTVVALGTAMAPVSLREQTGGGGDVLGRERQDLDAHGAHRNKAGFIIGQGSGPRQAMCFRRARSKPRVGL